MGSVRVLFVLVCLLASSTDAWASDLPPIEERLQRELDAALDAGPALRPGTRLPYRATVSGVMSWFGTLNPGQGTPHFVVDLDGDGDDDRLSVKDTGLQAFRVEGDASDIVWEQTLPSAFYRDVPLEPAGAVDGGFDVSGDGAPDVFVIAQTTDRTAWWMFVFDLSSGREHARHRLPQGEDRDGSGIWEGWFHFVTGHDLDRDGRVEQVVLLRSAAKDATARGLLALDPMTGSTRWEWTIAGGVRPRDTTACDLDGDGFEEILLGTWAVDNLDGHTIDGVSDDVSFAYRVDANGTTRWAREIGAVNTGAFPAAVDRGDGTHDALLLTSDVRADRYEVWLVDGATGDVRDRARLHERPIRVGTGPTGALVTTTSGAVLGLRADDEGLRVSGSVRVDGMAAAMGAFEVFPAIAGHEWLIRDQTGRVVVVDTDLRPLAMHDPEAGTANAQLPIVLRTKDGPSRILASNGARGDFTFEPTPATFPWPAGFGAVAVVVTGATLWARRRRARAAIVAPRDARRHLLDALELSDHGAIAGLRGLRRLNWHLQAMARGMGQSSAGHAEARRLLDEVRTHALPGLRAHLPWIELARLDGDATRRPESSLRALERQLRRLDTVGFEADPLAEVLTDVLDASDALEHDLQGLRRTIEAGFRADLEPTLARVLDACAESLRTTEVTIHRDGPGDVAVRLDPDELSFVLENLVSNAVRAMDGASTRDLLLHWTVDHGLVVFDAIDTGVGIARDDWERILESRYTSRDGEPGGAGLFRSRRILQRYGGRIHVLASEPAAGTHMRLELPVARNGDGT